MQKGNPTIEEVTRELNKLNEARIIESTESDFINLNNELVRLKHLQAELKTTGEEYLNASEKNKQYWKDLGKEQTKIMLKGAGFTGSLLCSLKEWQAEHLAIQMH